MPSQLEPMDSSNIAGDWTQRTHDLAVDEPEPADSAWPNPADGLVEYSRRLDSAKPMTWRSTNPNLRTRPGRTQQMDLPNRRFRSRRAGKFGWCVPGAGCPVPGSRCPVSSPLFIYVFVIDIFSLDHFTRTLQAALLPTTHCGHKRKQNCSKGGHCGAAVPSVERFAQACRQVKMHTHTFAL